jgi:hypothetical protein
MGSRFPFWGLLILFFAGSVFAKAPSPCSGVDRTLSEKEKSSLAQPLAAQLRSELKDVKTVRLLASYRYENWRILFVDPQVSDEVYLFYPEDPMTHAYLALWAGAASTDEGDAIDKWVNTRAPGIPSRLAHCFSWHVTKDPERFARPPAQGSAASSSTDRH